MAEKAYLVANPASACKAILFDAELCTGCLECRALSVPGRHQDGASAESARGLEAKGNGGAFPHRNEKSSASQYQTAGPLIEPHLTADLHGCTRIEESDPRESVKIRGYIGRLPKRK